MTESNFLEVIENLSRHPNLYTESGSFIENVLFLEGYALGAGLDGLENYHSQFTPFKKWVSAKFRNGETFPVNWTEFRNLFDSDEQALQNLPILYSEYLGRRSPRE